MSALVAKRSDLFRTMTPRQKWLRPQCHHAGRSALRARVCISTPSDLVFSPCCNLPVKRAPHPSSAIRQRKWLPGYLGFWGVAYFVCDEPFAGPRCSAGLSGRRPSDGAGLKHLLRRGDSRQQGSRRGDLCFNQSPSHKTTIVQLPLHFATFPTSDGRRSVSFEADIHHRSGGKRWGSLRQ